MLQAANVAALLFWLAVSADPPVIPLHGFSLVTDLVNCTLRSSSSSAVQYLGSFVGSQSCQGACLNNSARCFAFTHFTDGSCSGQCYGVTTAGYSPTAATSVESGLVHWPCREDSNGGYADDCSLNGVCVGGVCNCTGSWKGGRCHRLNVQPAPRNSGYRATDGGHNTR
jgi:hypothetical protein